ncbi:L-seryl-tRNA(Sec) selenium transferase [Pantoea coffeiphila]|uniref:L-seryl-tRNA(Sec) selenium transferase n=1 Tax=Pantoea coffeiphila TaxID=1465635 RepID=A0A2S9I9T4_9GAMM|nr:L-seryl-tRNA(Sec) selenium transferase [Pantoea coffeiphila]PRD14562.1 L-seryl-tRNA(Sec) selenium transferase [Pantoea coffeiphila]
MSNLFHQLPSIDSLLRQSAMQALSAEWGHVRLVAILREMQQSAREHIRQQHQLPAWNQDWANHARSLLHQQSRSGLRPVLNLSGTVLHTNLGRAQLAETAVAAAARAMRSPVTLEYSLDDAGRGHRDRALADLLCQLTGAEDACIVNNNAAAVLLMLAALAPGKQVIVSRGELVEIGGAFRIPDVMTQAGCTLREVGTTNRTHLKDYRQAIEEDTALLMKVHTSNYQIQGFTRAVSEAELIALGEESDLPVVVDLGSGSLIDLSQYGLPEEPMPQRLIAAGASLVSFSGDKLLGGPQAGIIIGKKALIERLQQHPLKRALRVDKVTLAALEATLQLYRQPDKLAEQLPTLRFLTRTRQDIQAQGLRLLPAVEAACGQQFCVALAPCSSQIGSGSLPIERLPGTALTLTPRDGSGSTLMALTRKLREGDVPVIGRIHDGSLWLDLRTLEDEELFIRMIST